jgi:cytochrome c oxidase subunit 2
MTLRRALRPLLGLCALLACGAAHAASGTQLFAVCVACHGAKGEGMAATNAPAIAGQDPAYLERQLQNFRSGVRGAHKADTYGAQMRATAATLRDDAAVASVADYVATLPRTTVKPATAADLHNGNNLYHGKCGACHGGKAEGNAALSAPRLAGLESTYIKRQLKHFREGVRGAHPRDRYGRQMAMMASMLPTAKDIDDVVAFIQTHGAVK